MKKLFCIVLFLGCISFSFAESWFVCLNSFKKEKNAALFVKKLKGYNIPSIIDKRTIGGTVFHRVLLNIPFGSRQAARNKIKALVNSPSAKKLLFKDLWICRVSKEVKENLPTSRHEGSKQSVVLTKNPQIPLSDKTPHSVLLNRYKEEQAAENGKKRLKAEDIDSYVVKTYDDSFSFDLHAGAFSTHDEAEELQNQLLEKGIQTKEISHYDNVKEKISKYNSIVSKEQVKSSLGSTELPNGLSPFVVNCIKNFPGNSNLEIERVHIFDFDNIRSFNNGVRARILMEVISPYLYNEEGTHAGAIAEYADKLFNKAITLIVQIGDENLYSDFTQDNDLGKALVLNSKYGLLDCRLSQDGDRYNLTGINKSKDILVQFISRGFSEEELKALIDNSSSDNSLISFPQIRRTLCVLPHKSANLNRDFLCFSLKTVGQSYVEEKGYTDWAAAIAGHWDSTSLFNIADTETYIGFFDMDYNYNAEKTQNMFKNYNRTRNEENENNHPVTLKNTVGWYVNSEFKDFNELSFAASQYIVAAGCNNGSVLGEKELVLLSEDLRIWD